ncbi:hypothetical protein YC2023_067107 [Brassica napus]
MPSSSLRHLCRTYFGKQIITSVTHLQHHPSSSIIALYQTSYINQPSSTMRFILYIGLIGYPSQFFNLFQLTYSVYRSLFGKVDMNSDPRGLRTDGSRGDTKGCGIAQRYYQTSIVAGCDAPVQQKKDRNLEITSPRN